MKDKSTGISEEGPATACYHAMLQAQPDVCYPADKATDSLYYLTSGSLAARAGPHTWKQSYIQDCMHNNQEGPVCTTKHEPMHGNLVIEGGPDEALSISLSQLPDRW